MEKKVVVSKETGDKKSKETEKPRVDLQIAKPGKYEITNNDTFKVEFYLKKINNRWIVLGDNKEKDNKIYKHWVEFRMWTFDEDVELRKKSMMYDSVKRINFIDNDQLNRLKVQKLLKAWSFEDDNPNLKLHHVNGVLTDESWDAFRKLHPNIVRYILEKMNDILEFNG